MKKPIVFILSLLLLPLFCSSCSNAHNSSGSAKNLLKTADITGIMISEANGSGRIRTLTLTYKENGQEKTRTMDDISYIQNDEYDDENGKAQAIKTSDFNSDGIFDVIVFREFWIPDDNMAHASIPMWPAVCEYDLNDGFVITSADFKEVFAEYAKAGKEQLAADSKYMDENEIKIKEALIKVAEAINDGAFIPSEDYDSSKYYYPDVYVQMKNIIKSNNESDILIKKKGTS